jgi:hypothetical protein
MASIREIRRRGGLNPPEVGNILPMLSLSVVCNSKTREWQAAMNTSTPAGTPELGTRDSPDSFDEVIDRTVTNSIKWSIPHFLLAADEAAAQPLPMWVADTDFKAPRAVIDALTTQWTTASSATRPGRPGAT